MPEDLDLIARVGQALVRHGRHKLAARLRRHYAAVRDGRPSEWPPELTIEWARVLRIPPHEHDFPVRPRMSTCLACEAAGRTAGKFVAAVFPGGSKHQCAGCQAIWLELDPKLR
jgi:hypothetical protein